MTGQHPGLMLSQHGLAGFDHVPLNCVGQVDPMVHADMVRTALSRLLRSRGSPLVMVLGDTSSALGGALAAKDAGSIIAHVEAGLRSHDPQLPWPEEINRTQIDQVADLMFAPTSANAANLHREAVRGTVHVTGNPGIDALADIVGTLPLRPKRRWFPKRSLDLLVTCHRRENWGSGIECVSTALVTLTRDAAVSVDVILHPNPAVAEIMWQRMGHVAGIRLITPQAHVSMVERIRRADIILSDSGGIQEEAPALGIPLLVLRDKTERPEGLASGTTELVGTDPKRIVDAVRRIRSDRALLERMARPAMPFGDGQAAPRIAALTIAYIEEMDSDSAHGRAVRA